VQAWTVLLIDEQEEFISTLAERLRLRGVDAHFATTLEQGRALLESLCPRVLVLDVTIHDMAGLDMIRSVRQALPSIPIVAVTDLCRSNDIPESARAGAFRCLMKPFPIEELIQAINDALGDS
jgi:two-component system, OmpR family, response regulator